MGLELKEYRPKFASKWKEVHFLKLYSFQDTKRSNPESIMPSLERFGT